MIKKISLKFGRVQGSAPEAIQTTPVTIFVGPNNAGKSKVLSEIHHYCATGQKPDSNVILESIEFDIFSEDVAEQKIRRVAFKLHPSQSIPPDHVMIGNRYSQQTISLPELITLLAFPIRDCSEHSCTFPADTP